MDEAGTCLLINLNQEDQKILSQIIDRSNSLEEGTLKPVNGGYLIPLDTKYYSAHMLLQVFHDFQTASQWAADSNKPVFALFVHCHIAQTSARLLSQVRELCRQLDKSFAQLSATNQLLAVLVGGNCSAFPSQVSLLQHFCISEGIEQIELAPNKETIELLNEYHERWGIDRMWEVLESVEWPCRQLKVNPTNLPAHRQRLQRQIDGFDKQDREQEDDLRDSDFPDSEDEAAILQVFDKFNFGLAEMMGNNYLGTHPAADETDANLETDAKSPATIPSTSIPHQSSPEDSKKGKKKKNKRSKGKSPGEEEEEEKCSTALTQQYSDGNLMGDVLGNVLKKSNSKDFKASSFDPTELNWGEDDISSVIGHINQLKERGAVLERNERVSLAEKVSKILLHKFSKLEGATEVENEKEAKEVKKLNEEEAKGDKKTV